MKTSRAFALVAAALIAGFTAARWCPAQSQQQPTNKEPETYDFGAMQQLASFVTYLQDTKQTNTLERFNNYLNASIACKEYSDIGVTVAVLRRLRNGQTNQVYEILEGQLDGHIVGFATSYRELPASLRDQTSLRLLGWAKDYRTKYPPHYHSQIIDDGVANAFKILDDK
jgi:hypothetical protein